MKGRESYEDFFNKRLHSRIYYFIAALLQEHTKRARGHI